MWIFTTFDLDQKTQARSLSLGTIASFNIGAEWRLLGLKLFELVDYLVSNIMLPAGGFLLAIFATWIVDRRMTASELGWQDNALAYRLWLWTCRLVTPLLIALVFADAIGLLEFSAANSH
jgi:NSS family neurotransmitter:Na+ symporter